MNHSVQNKQKESLLRFFFFLSLFGAWDGAGGAVTSCLKLHEVFTKPSAHQIPLQSALSGFVFCSFFFFLSDSKCKKVHFEDQ